jgi:hypothetical protein
VIYKGITGEDVPKFPDSAALKTAWEEGKVLDVNGQWVNVQDSEGLTDMWNISDIELVAELAA